MKWFYLTIVFSLCVVVSIGQTVESRIQSLERTLKGIEQERQEVLTQLEQQKLIRLRKELHRNGLPHVEWEDEVIHHEAMSLVYSEEHEQAKWVAHIITPDIITGNAGRSNDFRSDPKIITGSTVEEDYFLKFLQADSSYVYDGYGYDRGHLAPSADFRWSAKALSESYYYSNISPQAPEFNREKWAELEAMFRGYIYRNPETELLVVTGPILKPDLPKSKRSLNRVSIPELFFKVAVDLKNKRGIGFIMPNRLIRYPLESFAVSIDKVEEETGIDFFAALDDQLEIELEGQRNAKRWIAPSEVDDVTPIVATTLPEMHFNTVQAKRFEGTGHTVSVCGTVVSTKLSRKGNVFINLDKKFPNQVFSITIWKDNLINFDYEPEKELIGKQICVSGSVSNFNGVSTMNVEHAKQLYFLDDVMEE